MLGEETSYISLLRSSTSDDWLDRTRHQTAVSALCRSETRDTVSVPQVNRRLTLTLAACRRARRLMRGPRKNHH